ncbi:RidA family protein [bacterium]|nr:RidA family protein [bacterium]
MDNKKAVRTDAAPAPVGPYSQAVVAGELVFCSGQLAFDPVTGTLETGDIERETSRVMENLKAVLDAAGCSFDNVVKTTIFLRSMDDFGKVNGVYGRYFKDVPPARSTVQVGRLPKDANVEIECIAVK